VQDDAGWPKKMSAEGEAAYVAGLSDEERHCVVGLGGSQKAEVAWMDKERLKYEEHDAGQFFAEMSMETVEVFLAKHKEPKQQQQLVKVLQETQSMLRTRVATGTCIAVTCFRKGGVNADHGFLRQVQACLLRSPPSSGSQVSYVHFQSGFENSLFGWRSGCDKCEYGVEEYFELNMKLHWHIEWLEVVTQCGEGQGYLVVFDLGGDAAMSTSVNCAMELAISYRMFTAGDSGLRPIVLTDDDVILGDTAKLAAVISAKGNDQETQGKLFEAAYNKCYALLQSYFAEVNGLHEVGRAWTEELRQAGGGHHGVRRLSVATDSSMGHQNPQGIWQFSQDQENPMRSSGGGGGGGAIHAAIQHTENPMVAQRHAATTESGSLGIAARVAEQAEAGVHEI
jgi:hypothetical protein